jgi:small subunit ribosomal protein S18
MATDNIDDFPEGDRGPRGGGRPRGDGDDERPRRRGRRRRVCIMCAEHMKTVDYKDVGFLRRYVSDRARIETRRKSSSCAKHQRAVARAIKRARHLALIPYTPEHMRQSGYSR